MNNIRINRRLVSEDIGKHRNGELATIELAWIPEYIKFANKDYTNGMYS